MTLFFSVVEPKHVINWIVVRHPRFIAAMENLVPRNFNDTHIDAVAFKNTNILIRHMQIDGPMRQEHPNYYYDNEKDLFHCHTINAAPTYNVIWEADEALRIIHVLNIAPHENFDYSRKVNKKESIGKALQQLQNTDHYKKMFTVHNMRLHPGLKAMYADFMKGETNFPKVPTQQLQNMSHDEVIQAIEHSRARTNRRG